MKEPKYKIGDKVWRMADNKPVEAEIFSIRFTHDIFRYEVFETEYKDGGLYHPQPESALFRTKQDLLNSLWTKMQTIRNGGWKNLKKNFLAVLHQIVQEVGAFAPLTSSKRSTGGNYRKT